MNRISGRCYKQYGQAMTETLVTASTVLVPLLLLIPLIGKYIDIKHAAIQAARYEAWEYTAWYGDNTIRTTPDGPGERAHGFTNSAGTNLPQPVKDNIAVQQESRRRLFSATNIALSPDDLSGWVDNGSDPDTPEQTNTLWVDHQGNRLWSGEIPDNTLPASSAATPNHTSTRIEALLDVLDEAFNAISHGMNLPHLDAGFTAINSRGLAKSNVQLPVSVPAGLIDLAAITDPDGNNSIPTTSLDFEAGAAVLTDTWGSGGLQQTTSQVYGITPAKTLRTLIDDLKGSSPGMDFAWNIATSLAPEWRECNPDWPHLADPEDDGSLWFGYVNVDTVHPDRLDIGGTHQCPDGICNLSYQTYSPCN